jgi:sigma-B regulation protein RsbU (phosphoserine phosphatase)
VLRTITGEIGRGRDLPSFLQFCTEQIQEGLQNRFVVAMLRRENDYVATAKVGVADEIVGRFRLPATPELDEALGQWFDPRKRDLPADVIGALRRREVALVVPVSAHRRPLGLLALGTKLSDQELDLDDLDFLTSAASQIALGIENARLRTEEVEFTQARSMQQLLLPTHFPHIDGIQICGTWQPARSVGGDYFDALQLDPVRAGVCIGDVAGKGMPAALLMANLQAAVKATAASDVAPHELCTKVQRVVAGNLGGKFISFFYAVVDGAARTLTWCNAGHNPPIVVRASGAVERLADGGPVFARLFRDVSYRDGRIALEPGDRVVLFTDGASEASQGDEQFGEERLADVIAAHRHLDCAGLQEAILDAVMSFSGGELADDVTLLVISAS